MAERQQRAKPQAAPEDRIDVPLAHWWTYWESMQGYDGATGGIEVRDHAGNRGRDYGPSEMVSVPRDLARDLINAGYVEGAHDNMRMAKLLGMPVDASTAGGSAAATTTPSSATVAGNPGA